MRSTWWILGLVACTEPQLSVFDLPPQVSILSPEEGQRFDVGVLVELTGLASDDGGTDSLDITWSSDLDGRLGGDPPDAEGTVYWPVSDLSSGDHVITLEAIDASGAAANTSVGVVIGGTIETPPQTTPPDEDAPIVVLTSPGDLATFVRDDLVAFVGVVTDPQQPPESLAATLSSSTAGILWEGSPGITGNVTFEADDLEIGPHTITLTAVDDDGHVSSDDATIEILNDGRPFAQIDAPQANAAYLMGDAVTFEGTIWDLEDDSIDLTYLWTSDLDGDLSSGLPDSAGYTAFATAGLSAGIHLVTLTALDTDGQNAADSVLVEVEDPGDLDLDLDGHTPNGGDCDDTDPAVNPGAAEVCDGADNNCDGAVNEPFVDSYDTSANDDHATASSLGEIDNEQFGIEVVTLAGLTLHSDTDEDWFTWDADDDWYDNVDISVTLTLPVSGDYLVELYLDDNGSLVLKDSASGNTSLTIGAAGSANIFDEDEDIWVIRVTSTPGGWDTSACSGSYAVEITS